MIDPFDRTRFELGVQEFDQFSKQLDEPTEPNDALKALFDKKTVFEQHPDYKEPDGSDLVHLFEARNHTA